MTNLYNKSITIYNDIPADSVQSRRFFRHVIPLCNIQAGIIETATDGQIQNVINGVTVITKSIANYLPPEEYKALPEDKKANYFTVQIDDFVIPYIVEDIVTTAKDYQELQTKYKNTGWAVTAANAYIFGLSTDNVTINHA